MPWNHSRGGRRPTVDMEQGAQWPTLFGGVRSITASDRAHSLMMVGYPAPVMIVVAAVLVRGSRFTMAALGSRWRTGRGCRDRCGNRTRCGRGRKLGTTVVDLFDEQGDRTMAVHVINRRDGIELQESDWVELVGLSRSLWSRRPIEPYVPRRSSDGHVFWALNPYVRARNHGPLFR